jgi:GNAT superfamily N-acetyltransferase
MDDIEIHRIDHRSSDAVIALFETQLREHQITVSTKSLREAVSIVVDNPRYGFILLAMAQDGAAVGVAYASSLLSLEHGGLSGWLEELYVKPSWRARGIGSCLLQQVINTARELGWRALDLEVEATHQRAVSLYLRHRFRPHSRSRFYLKL